MKKDLNNMKKTITCMFLILSTLGCGQSASENTTKLTKSSKSDNFTGDALLTGYITNNAESLPDVKIVSDRYRAHLFENRNNKTLHYKKAQGRLDAKKVSFPFKFIARNIGIGTQQNSQNPIASTGGFNFAGVQVHDLNLDIRNSSHIVVGHRGKTGFTVEGKNTVNGVSTVDDIGANMAPTGRADIKVVGNADHSLTIYWQQPNQDVDNWQLYDGYKKGNGRLPGKQAKYGKEVYIGLITYAQGSKGLPFVGTCDSIEIYEQVINTTLN